MASSKKTISAPKTKTDPQPPESVERTGPQTPGNAEIGPESATTGARAGAEAGPQTAGSHDAAGVVGFDAFIAGNETILDTMAALNSEVTAFGGQRLDANLRYRDGLLDCHSPEDAFRLQSDFFGAAARDYLEQTNHVMKIMSDMTVNCWSVCGEQSKEILANLGKASLPPRT